MARRRLTEDLSEFDVRSMLLLDEGITLHGSLIGRTACRTAVGEMPLVFDLRALEVAVTDGNPMLASVLVTSIGGLSRRSDWPAHRAGFAGAVREAHVAEVRLRVASWAPAGG